MITLARLLLLAPTIVIAPFFGFLALILVAGVWPARRRPAANSPASPSFLVVIPAHDEEGVIASTVTSCRAMAYDAERFSVWVIADNCEDGTAGAARLAGARVVERRDPSLRSKGHALEYFFTHVTEAQPESGGYDAVVLVDADTVVDPALLSTFSMSLAQGADWIQGYYSVRNPDASWRTQMMTYAFSLANGVWMLGLDRLGLSVGLKGNGMCFSRQGLRRFPWKAYGLVEDMEFALMLRTEGERVRFLPDARVFGEMVSRGGPGAASQRRRWEAGRRALRGKFAGPLIRSSHLGPVRKLLYLTDLVFPPLVSLAIGLGVATLIHLAAALDGRFSAEAAMLLPIHALMVATLVGFAFSPLVAVGLPVRYLSSLAMLPYYAAWKLAVAAGRGPSGWVRTPREPQGPA